MLRIGSTILKGEDEDIVAILTRLTDVSFVDDIAIIITSTLPIDLAPRVARAVEIIARILNKFNLRLNFAQGKSEAMVHLAGHQAP